MAKGDGDAANGPWQRPGVEVPTMCVFCGCAGDFLHCVAGCPTICFHQQSWTLQMWEALFGPCSSHIAVRPCIFRGSRLLVPQRTLGVSCIYRYGDPARFCRLVTYAAFVLPRFISTASGLKATRPIPMLVGVVTCIDGGAK